MSLLKNATAVTLSPPSVTQTDLRIGDGRIVSTGTNLRAKSGEEIVDLGGRIVMPGSVCAHTHLYSSLARAMPPPSETPRNFLEILRLIWWKLDRALDEESIYYSALAGGLDALMCGTTTVVDHHSSPGAITGSLDIIKEALGELGLRSILCYEVTDRGGRKERDLGLRENERFIRSNRKNRTARGLVGAHAAFTMSNESLRRCGEMAAHYRTGVHIHLGEDPCDETGSMEDYRCSVVERLSRHGILRKESVLAHCIHLPRDDYRTLQERGPWLVHNPRSNMNNGVGRAPVHFFGERVALGTDGFPADMFEETRSAALKANDPRSAAYQDRLPALLRGSQELVSETFGEPIGSLRKGSAADLIVLDYQPPTPISASNLAGHLVFGLRSSMVVSAMAAGKWIMKDRKPVNVDARSIAEKSANAAKKLWERMAQL
jgi:putative selenium metabolism protein SsnA